MRTVKLLFYVSLVSTLVLSTNLIAQISNGLPVNSPINQANQPLTGCGVEYISALIFEIGTCTYTINGRSFTSVLTSKTLSAADATNPRIDVIGVDDTGIVVVLIGTPAASPQQPTIDPATQLGLTFVYIAALATTPSGISLVNIYSENIEWTSAVTANFNAASASNPYRGTIDIEATTAVLTNSVTLTKPAAGTENLTSWDNLVFYIRSKAAWPTGSGANAARVLNIFWLSGATQIGVPVVLRDGVYNFNSGTLGVYQQVSIPTSLFGTGSSTVTALKIQVAGATGSTSIGFHLDAISLQLSQGGSGVVTPPVVSTQQHSINFVIDGGGSVITTGDKGIYPTVGFTCVINRVDISADQSGSITVDIWKRAGLIPTAAQIISSSAPLTLSAQQLRQNGSLVGWTTGVASGDVFGFSVATVTTVTRVVGQIWCQ